MPTKGECAAGAVVLCAECCGCGGSALDSMEVYDPVAAKWSAGAALGTARRLHSCVVLEDKLWAVGGLGADERRVHHWSCGCVLSAVAVSS